MGGSHGPYAKFFLCIFFFIGSSVSTRRRRSSVPSYSVFSENFFSDESDGKSPEEIYTSAEDSDDDWTIPRKRTRTKKPAKVRPFKVKLESQYHSDRPRRKCAIREASTAERESTPEQESATEQESSVEHESTNEQESAVEQESSVEPESAETETPEKQHKTPAKELRTPQKELRTPAKELKTSPKEFKTSPKEFDIQVEVKSETIENFEKADEESVTPAKEEEKRASKIKVIDLAKLKSNNTGPAPTPATTINANSFIIQTAPLPNTLPVIGSCTSQSMNAYMNVQPRIVARAPGMAAPPGVQVVNYAANRLQPPFVMTSVRRKITPQNVTVPQSPQSVLRALGCNAYPNSGGVVQVRRATPPRPLLRGPSMADKFVITGMAPKAPIAYEKKIQNAVPIPKISKNVTVVPTIVGKPVIQRRPLVREIEGAIGIHSNNGLLQYVVNLANGSHVPLSNEQVRKLRDGNGGVLPQKLKIPVPADVAEKIEPCVVIDD